MMDTSENKNDRNKNVFYSRLRKNLTEELLTQKTEVFNQNKYAIIKLLLEAYRNFSYEKIKNMYIKYLTFYRNAFNGMPFFFSKDTKESFDELTTQIRGSGTDYFVYLSCILPSEVNFMKFEMSKMLISYLGFRYNEDSFIHSVDIIMHDFGNPHEQYSRKISFNQPYINTMREFLIKLYNYFKSDMTTFENIIKFIHASNYEKAKKIDINDIITQILENCVINRLALFAYVKSMFDTGDYHLILSSLRFARNKVINIKEQIKEEIKQKTDATFSTEINKFIDNVDYKFDLNDPLDSEKILYKYIVIQNFDTLYSFMMFLKDSGYNYVFTNNNWLRNMTLIKLIYDSSSS